VLEISGEALDRYRDIMVEIGMKKEYNLLESVLKRNSTLKKGF
jgi:hypothetical protein